MDILPFYLIYDNVLLSKISSHDGDLYNGFNDLHNLRHIDTFDSYIEIDESNSLIVHFHHVNIILLIISLMPSNLLTVWVLYTTML